MSDSRHYPNFTTAQLVHQWSSKNGTAQARVEVTRQDESEQPNLPCDEPKRLSKMERLQYVGGIRRIEVKRDGQKTTDLDSPLGQQRLAKMKLMKRT